MNKFRVGIVGCGFISDIYLQNCERFPSLEVLACSDLSLPRAQEKAAGYGIPKACTVDELLSDQEIDGILNLTIPKAHHEIALASLNAGKHVYSEKPLGVNREEGKCLVDAAHAAGVYLGCAPDTFLGAGLQTCRKLIDGGAIGKPTCATAFMACHGHEGWHPNPEFYYEVGGGPMFDMGPYYITALLSLLGPVERVSGSIGKALNERILTSMARAGDRIPVETATHIAGQLEFKSGAIGSIITSFDIWNSNLPLLEIHGTLGSLKLPDPNTFAGPVLLYKAEEGAWNEVPLSHGFETNSRGLGLADLALAVAEGRPPRASGDLAYHVLDIMEAFYDSSKSGRFIELTSGVERPEAMPVSDFQSFGVPNANEVLT